ncbi:MAG: cell division protein FtsZ [Prolixibacteraceae bacterium]|nr:cell division protein FtsZ [Prolixibacteraceae bacterium]
MENEFIQFDFTRSETSIIKVVGVGGGGCNAVNYMFEEGITGVEYIVCNTDGQALANSPVPIKIQLGVTLTEGRGAGNRPQMGEQAALENYDDLKAALANTKMLFITAGMGGGTGTGAAPVIAELARELDILTIAVVTIPSPSEGAKRFNQANDGIEKLRKYVDSMLIVNNQRLRTIYGELPARQAFKLADKVVATAVKGVAEIITLHGNINIDFADVHTVMHDSKVFIMGTGLATGGNRAMDAVKQALRSPLLDNQEIKGTKNILLNLISGNYEITIGEIGEIIEYLQMEAGQEADIIWGNGCDEAIGDQISVTILCTGFHSKQKKEVDVEYISLGDVNNSRPCPGIETETHFETEPIPAYEGTYHGGFKEKKEAKIQTVFELEIDDNEKYNSRVKAEEKTKKPIKEKTQKPKKTKTVKETGDINNWFFNRFSKFFDDEDQNINS